MPDTPDTRGWIAQKLDFLFGVGWTKDVARVGSLAQLAILGIATGAINLEDFGKINVPFVTDHWKAILSACLLINKTISWYQSAHQATATAAIQSVLSPSQKVIVQNIETPNAK